MISVYTTCKDEGEAKEIANQLVKERLIACANIFPITSVFWWRNKVNETGEFAMLMKTKKGNFEKVRERIRALHSYDVPLIMAFDVFGKDEDYFNWMKEELDEKNN